MFRNCSCTGRPASASPTFAVMSYFSAAAQSGNPMICDGNSRAPLDVRYITEMMERRSALTARNRPPGCIPIDPPSARVTLRLIEATSNASGF